MTNPAIEAAKQAQQRVDACLDEGRNFRLEAGAGAGKTYSLVEALKKLINERGRELQRDGKKVACITYTEVAREEIAQEIEQHPAILVQTIHAFCWGFMSKFQKDLRALVAALEDKQDKIAEAGGVSDQIVEYQFGFFGIDERRITLHHDDVPRFMAQLLGKPKFRALFAATYPVIFVDEYQDTDPHFMAALAENFLATGTGPRIGLFGDHWQTIYRSDYGLAAFPSLESIDKGSNFRSVPAVVNVLNALRPTLKQAVKDPDAVGEARFFHANSYTGERTNSSASKNDTPPEVSRDFMAKLLDRLKQDGWDLSSEKTKILMLTHNAIAAERGYPTIAKAYRYNDSFAKKEDPLIAFLVETVEPMCLAFTEKRFGDMFRILGTRPELRSHEEKVTWATNMAALADARSNGSIGDVVDLLKKTRRPQLPDRVAKREQDLAAAKDEADLPRSLLEHRLVREAPYQELVQLAEFIEGQTPFATQHSVKGAEFDNVIVVLGGGWNHYNWPQLLELLTTGAITAKNEKGYYRARNLFYVSISRPKKRLAVLATQTMSSVALQAVNNLFGQEKVIELNL
ncbi:UvrD-helicase domain-containing protein [Novosphingobium sp. Fuku2-ISO-50]|uniref:UvrD-helicase domain-containing protein n=1 Tax=Novosphingobium sp. Fuku2-ISO-50 TaxID=1739114 RepID=UPI00076D70D0|nr:UvrD-helicase domain-containing protein [Novosphingobium sp. Fuku2-ISO-50]KUR75195.1 DNA helicase II [Novosphingobium sp. Fuku2-ISO-50]